MNAAPANPIDANESSAISVSGNLSNTLGGVVERLRSSRSTIEGSNPNSSNKALTLSIALYLRPGPELRPCLTTETSMMPTFASCNKHLCFHEKSRFWPGHFRNVLNHYNDPPSFASKEYSRYCIVPMSSEI